MRGIYTLDREGKIILHEDSIKLSPILMDLSEAELRYIILVYDYVCSPYARKPIDDRRELAIRDLGDIDESKLLREIDELNSLIFDSKRYTIDLFINKISKLNKDLMDTEDSKEIESLDKSISILQKRVDEYEADLVKDNDRVILKGGKELSLLERMKRSKKLWELNKEI